MHSINKNVTACEYNLLRLVYGFEIKDLFSELAGYRYYRKRLTYKEVQEVLFIVMVEGKKGFILYSDKLKDYGTT